MRSMRRTLGRVSLLLAAIPLINTLVNLFFYLRPPIPPLNHPPTSISVLIPARNEEDNIADAIAHVLANTSPSLELELLVLDDSSTDRTPDILASLASSDLRIHVIQGSSLPPGWSGKQFALSTLSLHANKSSDLFVFIDADVRLAPTALSRISLYMASHPTVHLASGVPKQLTPSLPELLLIPLIHFILLGYLPLPLASHPSLSTNPAFAAGCGQLFIARPTSYFSSSGHASPLVRHSLHDGLTLPRTFRSAGYHTALFDATDIAWVRMYDGSASGGWGEVWRGLSKNAREGMAKPFALPVWTLLLAGGHIFPFVLLLSRRNRRTRAPWLAVFCSYTTRAILAVRFGQSWLSVFLHPLGVSGVLAIQWVALVNGLLGGGNTWRGRNYEVF